MAKPKSISVYHPENTRGFQDMEGIKLYQSFQQYYPPALDRKGFGIMVGLNNTLFKPGLNKAYTYRHVNNEILSITVSGKLMHYDSTGNNGIIPEGAVQLISAGTGVAQTEYNYSESRDTDMLQLRFLAKEKDISPRYQMKTTHWEARNGKLDLLASPTGESNSLIINQDVWVYRGDFPEGENIFYGKQNPDGLLYIFIIEGKVFYVAQEAKYRDGFGIIGTDPISLKCIERTDLLIIELPPL